MNKLYKSKRYLFALGGSLAAMISTSSGAQAAPPPSPPVVDAEKVTPETAKQAVADGSNMIANEGPSDRAGFAPGRPKLELSTNEGGTAATFTIGASGVSSVDARYKPGFQKVNRQALSFSAIVPINGSDKDSPFTFGDLGNFEKVEFSFTSYSSFVGSGRRQNPNDPALKDLRNAATINCLKEEVAKIDTAPDPRAPWEDFIDAFEKADPISDRQSVLNNSNVETDGTSPIPARFNNLLEKAKEICGKPGSGAVFVSKYVGAASAAVYRATLASPRPIRFWGLAATAGQSKRDYIDVAAFAKASESRTAIAASGYVGLITSDYKWALRLKYDYLRDVKPAANGQICRASATAANMQECLEGALGRPTRSETNIASFELRHRFSLLNGDNKIPVAIAPQITYDFDKKEYGIDVPVYLTQNKEGKLNGGIRFGYRSDTKDVGAGVFIGVPFQLPF